MLCENLDINLVVFEKKSQTQYLTDEEIKYFGDLRSWNPKCQFVICEKGEINSTKIEAKIRRSNPDVCFVFGTSILKKNIFEIPRFGCVNIHTGLTQYFRGVDSAFWSIFEENLEGLGATIHSINAGIDTGNVIYQVSPLIEASDSYMSLFLKSCNAGFKEVFKNLEEITSGDYLKKAKPLKKGRLFVSSDKTIEKELIVKEKTKRVIEEYLNAKS
jgi:methionyl-tRNA formyltransferase